MFGYELVVIVLMLVFNAIFAAYEMGLASISRARITFLLSEKKKGAAEAAFMKDKMEASLATIQLGITMAGVAAAATGGAGVQETFVPYLQYSLNISVTVSRILAIVVLMIPLTFVIIIFGELVPKMMALNNKEWVVLRLSPVMKVLSQIAYPVVLVVEIIVKKVVGLLTRWGGIEPSSQRHWLHELRAAVSLARTSQLMGEREEKIVLAAAHLSTHLVRDIMMPAQDISTIYIGSSLPEALVKAHLDMHTRFPVCTKKDDPQSIEGYVNFKDVVSAMRVNPSDPTIRGISRPIKKVNEDMPLSRLLEEMIREKNHIVIVISGDGTIVGMVTLEDIIEELVGEIEDEFDRLPTHIHPCGSSCWVVGGGVSMGVVTFMVGLDWSGKFGDGKVPTVAEWCVQQVGPLKGGEVIESDGLKVVPRKFRRKKVSEAMVTVIGH
ncbi:MAG: CNNM domain-containing protein [Phycisphaerae bacterium]|nr:CNNM domain-containing protein [Phycisphaerae bacterium]MDD5381426.1 CNNM domain-containing protein [Phycisphaerae bacterium]